MSRSACTAARDELLHALTPPDNGPLPPLPERFTIQTQGMGFYVNADPMQLKAAMDLLKLAQNITFARDFIQSGNDTSMSLARRTCRHRRADPVRRHSGLS